MLSNHFKTFQQYKYNQKRYLPEENNHTNTEELVGIQQKPQQMIDWLPIMSIIAAAIICFIAFIILCKRHINHRGYIRPQIKQRGKNRNRNNNRTSWNTYDVAECIDGDIEFVAGLNINLARGSFILNDGHAQMKKNKVNASNLRSIYSSTTMLGLIVIFTIISFVEPMAFNVTGKNQQCCGTCFVYGCPVGQCCSQYGYCGATPEHCQGAITQGDCKNKGCPDGLCCSKFGFCGNTPQHCDNTPITNGNCKTEGCPPGQCCSRHGFCGATLEHCGNLDPTAGQGNCQQTGCAPGLCCSRFGYCGRTAEHCAGTPGSPAPGGCATCHNNVLPSCGTTGCAGKK
ncbi:unnamed protein product [Rotaria socialis]|uniref:Chitin-binding type-1 domain-containing protein n=1 Tax=Rotaria socialis TaxID=392032 RepID=A0A820UPE4_9BILA|nr:unnamed protein product [Rotaria socialis]CAF4488284.1 unnamed protein product [Rotaria socialis]